MTKKPNIIIKEDKLMKEYSEELKIVLEKIGHPEAWISSESIFWDFEHDNLYDQKRLKKLFGFDDINSSTYLWEVAKKIREQRERDAKNA